MAYNQFTLEEVKREFKLKVREESEAFGAIAEAAVSELLVETLRTSAPLALALSTEKARSEMIITPILLEVHRQRRGS